MEFEVVEMDAVDAEWMGGQGAFVVEGNGVERSGRHGGSEQEADPSLRSG